MLHKYTLWAAEADRCIHGEHEEAMLSLSDEGVAAVTFSDYLG